MCKNLLPILSLVAIILVASPRIAAQQTRLLTPDRYSDYGLVYALPATAIEVEITARHTIRQAGPFRQYALKYLGPEADVIMEDSESWEVENVRMRPYGVANDSAIYRMQLKPGQPISLCVAADGMLLAVNTTVDAPEGWSDLQNPEPIFLSPATEFLQYVGEEYSAAQNDARRAALLAASLANVRQSRLDLTRGTADNMPTDGRQLELMLNSLQHQEELFINAFRGREISERRTARFTLVPDGRGDNTARYVVARLADYGGFLSADDLRGTPVYVDITPLRKGEIPLDENGKAPKMPREGVMYNLPGVAQVSVVWHDSEIISQQMEMAQFGTTFALDPALFINKKAPAFAIFNPATGALVKLGEQKAAQE